VGRPWSAAAAAAAVFVPPEAIACRIPIVSRFGSAAKPSQPNHLHTCIHPAPHLDVAHEIAADRPKAHEQGLDAIIRTTQATIGAWSY
jgi:hypothetical protein